MKKFLALLVASLFFLPLLSHASVDSYTRTPSGVGPFTDSQTINFTGQTSSLPLGTNYANLATDGGLFLTGIGGCTSTGDPYAFNVDATFSVGSYTTIDAQYFATLIDCQNDTNILGSDNLESGSPAFTIITTPTPPVAPSSTVDGTYDITCINNASGTVCTDPWNYEKGYIVDILIVSAIIYISIKMLT